jgi:peptidoglycan/xylan/chitin deacetylase (PgdA/CDA1 family)
MACAVVIQASAWSATVHGDSGAAVLHGDRGTPCVALTFDACTTRDHGRVDEGVLRLLRETGTPATLFLGGRWMREHPDVVRRLGADTLFELANHTDTHPHLLRCSDNRIRRELLRTQETLRSLTGRTAYLFRPPFGEYDARVERIGRSIGLRLVEFDLASGDPDSAATARRLTEYVVRHARNGSIVVFHMNGRGRHTAEALPTVIARLRKKGFRLVRVGDLLAASSPTASPASVRRGKAP